jgi:hypothetical protein
MEELEKAIGRPLCIMGVFCGSRSSSHALSR